MKQAFIFLAFIFTLAITSCSKDEEVTTGTIAGLVTDYSNANRPVAGATLTLNENGQTKTTGTDGRFEFTDLEPKTYTIQAQADEYQATTQQVNVLAGQTAICDFQLEKSAQSKSILISPETLVIGADTNYGTITMQNSTNTALDYTISCNQSFLEISPSNGKLSAKGQRVIIVTVINRQNFTTQRTASLIFNIGNDSYAVSVIIDPYQSEAQDIEISPTSLVIDANLSNDEKIINIHNNNTYSQSYSINVSNNIKNFILTSPNEGTLKAKSKTEILASLRNREQIASDINGTISITAGSSQYSVSILIKGFSSTPDPTPNPTTEDVTRCLEAYYTFDNNSAEDSKGYYDGFLSGGSFTTNTINGKGKALNLAKGQYMTIGSSPLSGATVWSVSMWVKDFGRGVFIRSTTGNEYDLSPTWNIGSNGKITYNTYDRRYSTFNAALSSYASNWTMITIVSGGSGDPYSPNPNMHTLYVNGIKATSIISDGTRASSNTSLQIGGQTWYDNGNYVGYDNAIWTNAMKVDNIRIYSTVLTSEEVKTIYNLEKK